MGRSVNKWTGIGNLGRDPETRYSQGGTAFSNFSVACSERRKKCEEWVDHTEWVNVVAIGKTAEACGKYLHKGSKVYVDGRLQTRKWDDKEGNTRYSTEVVVSDIVFLDSKPSDGQPRHEEYPGPDDEDIPF